MSSRTEISRQDHESEHGDGSDDDSGHTWNGRLCPTGADHGEGHDRAAYVHVLANDPPLGAASIPANPAIQPGQTQRFTAAMTAKGIYSWQCGEREDAQDDDEFGNLLVQ